MIRPTGKFSLLFPTSSSFGCYGSCSFLEGRYFDAGNREPVCRRFFWVSFSSLPEWNCSLNVMTKVDKGVEIHCNGALMSAMMASVGVNTSAVG
eukprot:scaffold2812_cov255-Skeletonema_marinoi.AAC.8